MQGSDNLLFSSIKKSQRYGGQSEWILVDLITKQVRKELQGNSHEALFSSASLAGLDF